MFVLYGAHIPAGTTLSNPFQFFSFGTEALRHELKTAAEEPDLGKVLLLIEN